MRTLQKKFADEIVAHALEDTPNECCGILAGAEGVAKGMGCFSNSGLPDIVLRDPVRSLALCRRLGHDNLASLFSEAGSGATHALDYRAEVESFDD